MQYLALCLWLFCFFTCMNCRFLQQPQPIKYGCTSKAVTLPWKVDAFGTIAFLEWTYNSTTTIMRQIGPTGTPTPEGAYVGRVENGSNSELLIKSTTIADTGGYQCIINYSNGTQVPSDVVSLYIRDEWSVMVEITGKKDGQSTTLKSNVDDPSIQQTWSTGFQGSSITVDKDGIYSLCISGGKADCLDSSSNNCTSYTVEGLGSTTESTIINLSSDVGTTTNLETSSKMSTESLSPTQTSFFFGSTESVNTKPETSTAPVTTSPSGLSEEMIIIISIVSVGGILLIVIIVIVVLCCRQRTDTAKREKYKNKPDKLHFKNGNNKDLNSNYEQSQKIKHPAYSGRKIQGGTDLYQKHPENEILYGGRMPTGVEFPRSQNFHEQNYFPRNQHHYRNQNSAYYLPYRDSRNVMHHQRYPGSGYNEDMLGYSSGGPYRMQQFYSKSYACNRFTDVRLGRRIGHGRGKYEEYWTDTLY